MFKFFYGCMGAGKTKSLLEMKSGWEQIGKTVLLFKPETDTRDGRTIVRSRTGESAEAIVVPANDPAFISDYISQHECYIVIVDEAQFLSEEQVCDLRYVADKLGALVFAYGLKTDFRRKLFPASARLLALADVSEEIPTYCRRCYSLAIFNARIASGKIVTTGNEIELGGDEKYEAVCSKCYNKLVENS